jgi:putative two-component system response regulator
MAIVDVYDAVHTRRLYGTPMPHAEALALISRGSGTHFDPTVVEAFLVVSEAIRELADDCERTSDETEGPPALAANA